MLVLKIGVVRRTDDGLLSWGSRMWQRHRQPISWYLKKASFKQLDVPTLAVIYCNKYCGTFINKTKSWSYKFSKGNESGFSNSLNKCIIYSSCANVDRYTHPFCRWRIAAGSVINISLSKDVFHPSHPTCYWTGCSSWVYNSGLCTELQDYWSECWIW